MASAASVPVPTHNDINSWKTLLRRLARSFRHRYPTPDETALMGDCFMSFTIAYPQVMYKWFPNTSWAANGYATWFHKASQCIKTGGATEIKGDLLVSLTALCNGLSASRYSGVTQVE